MTETATELSEQPLNPHAQEALRGLMRTWMDFERKLAKVPILRRLDTGTFSTQDYQRLLFNLRGRSGGAADLPPRARPRPAEVRSIVISAKTSTETRIPTGTSGPAASCRHPIGRAQHRLQALAARPSTHPTRSICSACSSSRDSRKWRRMGGGSVDTTWKKRPPSTPPWRQHENHMERSTPCSRLDDPARAHATMKTAKVVARQGGAGPLQTTATLSTRSPSRLAQDLKPCGSCCRSCVSASDLAHGLLHQAPARLRFRPTPCSESGF